MNVCIDIVKFLLLSGVAGCIIFALALTCRKVRGVDDQG